MTRPNILTALVVLVALAAPAALVAATDPLAVVSAPDGHGGTPIVGYLKNKSAVITDAAAKDLDVGSVEDRDQIRRQVARTTVEYANEFVKNFDAKELAERLKKIYREEDVGVLPDHVMKFIGSLDMVEIDDFFEGANVDKEKTDLDRIKMAYVIKSLSEYATPPGGPEGHGEAVDETVPTIDPNESIHGQIAAYGDVEFKNKMEEYENGFRRSYKFQVPQPHATDKEREESGGEGAVMETTDNFGGMIPQMQEIGRMVDGLQNSRTTNWWRNLQAAGVEQASGPDDSSKNGVLGSDAYQGADGSWWRVKSDWWFHSHEDGTIRSFAQENTSLYRPPALEAGAQLLSTEKKMIESDELLTTDLGKFRALVTNAEQKVLYIDYEHFPKGMTPGKISEGIWGYGEDGKPISVAWFDPSLCTPEQMEGGIRFDWHELPDGTAAPQPEEVVVDSDHPYGNTADGTGEWDLMVIRAVYWKDIQIPIYQYDLSYKESGYPEEVAKDEEQLAKVKSEDVVLQMEKEVDAYDYPPDLVEYLIPPLLEPPLPPTTFTRNEYPMGVSYGGMGGR